jgi:hypothetical protein
MSLPLFGRLIHFKEVKTMWDEPCITRLKKIPRLYETETTPLQDKLIHLHFFIGGCDWYVVEYDGEDLFWGFAILNEDYEMAEWGYISFSELKAINLMGWLEVDCETEEAWQVRRAIEVDKIMIAQGWIREIQACEKGGIEGDDQQSHVHQG